MCLATRAQQDTTLSLIFTVKGDIADFTVDNLGNIFLLDADNQLKKINSLGDSVAVFNNVIRYGKLTHIDATNPLKLLLYYKDFNTVVTLDRLLNLRGTIDLRRLQIFQVKAVCQSFDNGVWVYDEMEARLKRIADDGTITEQTGDLRQQLEEAPSPTTLIDQEMLVYMYDSTRGFLVFDYFGNLKNKLAFTHWSDVQVIGKYIVGRKGPVLYRYQLNSMKLEERTLKNILTGATRIRVAIDRLYCLRAGRLYVYKL